MSDVFTGVRARFKIDTGNGPEKVAYAGGVSGEESVDYEPVDVLDLLEVHEHVPVAYRCTMNAQVFRVIGTSMKNLGIFPIQDNILTSGALSALVEDVQEGRTMALLQGVRATGKGWDVGARSLVQENVSFVAIRMKDESEV